MAQNNPQNESVADLEAELAASRERLARNIDEIVHRAQPKTIVESQTAKLKADLKARYASLMGTAQTESYTRTGEATGPSTKAKVEEFKAQAQAKAEELKVQAQAKAEELKAQAQAKRNQDGTEQTVVFDADGASTTTSTTRAGFRSERDADGDLLAQARVMSDQARLKLDELTHTEDGELRTDRVAAGLAAAGAVLTLMGAARRTRD